MSELDDVYEHVETMLVHIHFIAGEDLKRRESFLREALRLVELEHQSVKEEM